MSPTVPSPTRSSQLDLPTIVDTASRFLTTEYASLTRAGSPVTWPVTPYRGVGGDTLDVATGLTYPLKAERARRDPRVALSFSYPVGSGVPDAPTLLVQGLATVRDADLVATSSRYLQVSADRFPEAFAKLPAWQLRRMDWYWTRQWIEVTPLRVWAWPGGDLGATPQVWRAPTATTAPASDPAPPGRPAGSWSASPPTDWRRRTEGAIERLGMPVVTTVDAAGWPLPWRAVSATATPSGFALRPPEGLEVGAGPASVTFHTHAQVFDGQENIGLVGQATVDGDGAVQVTVERALADFGLPRNPLRSAVHMWRAGRQLRPRLEREARRRGSPPPKFDELGFRRPGR